MSNHFLNYKIKLGRTSVYHVFAVKNIFLNGCICNCYTEIFFQLILSYYNGMMLFQMEKKSILIWVENSIQKSIILPSNEMSMKSFIYGNNQD